MLKENMTIEMIMKFTKLKKEEIERHDETIIKDKDGGELDE